MSAFQIYFNKYLFCDRKCRVLCLLIFFIAVLISPATSGSVTAAEGAGGEIGLKVRYVEQFIYFVNWPETDSDVFIIGVIGRSDLGDALGDLDGEQLLARDKTIFVKYFDALASGEDLKKCQMIYVPRSEKDNFWDIRRKISAEAVLTVGDWPGFTREKGMINLTIINDGLAWSINHSQMRKNSLEADAQLLRNAESVITVESELFGR